MTDGQILLTAFVLLLVLEGLRWVPDRARLWVHEGTQPDGRPGWERVTPWSLLRARGGAFLLVPVVPPVRAHFLSAAWPCAPHPQGLCLWDDQNGAASHVPWSDLKVTCQDSVLHLAPGYSVRCVHAIQARTWAALIDGWKTLPQAEREAAFLAVAAAMLDTQSLAKRAATLRQETRLLRGMGTVILVWCFGVLPALWWQFGETWPALAALGGLFLLTGTQAGILVRTARRDPVLRHEVWAKALAAALFPPSAIRAADWVCINKSPEVHPLTAEFLFNEAGKAELSAARIWRLGKWPVGDFPHRPWVGPETKALGIFFEKMRIDLATLETLPSGGPGILCCPRCLATYSHPAVSCPDCGGITLVPCASTPV